MEEEDIQGIQAMAAIHLMVVTLEEACTTQVVDMEATDLMDSLAVSLKIGEQS